MAELQSSVLLSLAVGALIMFGAGVVHGTLGLGFPLTATPLLALFSDVRGAILLTLLPTVLVNLVNIFHGGGWRQSLRGHWPLALYAVVGSALGTRLLILLDPAPFRLLLAAAVLAYLYRDRLHQGTLPIVKSRPALAMLLFGSLAGLLAGTVNVMVPVLIIYTLESGLGARQTIQVFNMCFLAGKLTQIGVFYLSGLLDGQWLAWSLPLVAAAALGVVVGIRLRVRIPVETYRGILRKVLLAIALLLVVQFIAGH